MSESKAEGVRLKDEVRIPSVGPVFAPRRVGRDAFSFAAWRKRQPYVYVLMAMLCSG
ncbi:MAG: hypothetical protein OSB19_16740 [Opitutaceae bacterium]|nr:hypothetical protein [Opitutaceae bacterium]